ncbi:MAG: NAD(P)-dependent oxidoreductase [Geminicoccaceae bacterium]|nr:NAD(P)-dependent oxidoreductase [Geminicoccaceae bacterium]
MSRILMTGAAGGVASMLRPHLAGHFDEVVLSDIVPVTGMAAHERFVEAPLADPGACRAACRGMDGIVHLGGFAHEGPWETIHEANIVGCYNIFEAARLEGVPRVVFASSNHAIGFYRRTERIGSDRRVRPDTRYGVSKAFGEALGSYYADKFGLRVLSIRIGNVAERPLDERRLSIWIHPEDLAQLIRIGIEHPDLHNEVVFGASDNDRSWWDNHIAYALGYAPAHRSEDHLEHAMEEQGRLAADTIGQRFQGGGFCSDEFAGDLDRL